MKVKVNDLWYEVPEWMVTKVEGFKEQYPYMYPVHALDAILEFNYDGIIDSEEVVKFRYDNNLEDDTVASVMALAVVNKVYGIEVED